MTETEDDVRITQKSRFERLTGVSEGHGRTSVLDVVNELRVLGSARKIADLLAEADIAGIKHVPQACPIAIYIEKRTGEQVSVGEDHIFIGKVMVTANVYGPIHQFVREFDKGLYPELEMEAAK
jgi:hypothetical protein